MRDWPFSAQVEPQVAIKQLVEPGVQHIVGDSFIAPQAQSQIANLRTTQTSRGTINQKHRTEAELLIIQVCEIGLLLAEDRSDGSVHEALRRRYSHLFRFMEGDNARGMRKSWYRRQQAASCPADAVNIG